MSKHEYEFTSALPVYGQALGLFAIGLGMAAAGVAMIVFGGRKEAVMYVLGGIFTFFGLLMMAVGAFSWPWQGVRWVRVYQEGVRWKARGKVHTKRWEEVESVSRSEHQRVNPDGTYDDWGRTSDLGIRFTDGTTARFTTTLTLYDRLARLVQEHVAARQLASAAAELDGEGKLFGHVHIARDGVTVIDRHFPWKELKWLQVDNGHLCADPSCRKWEPVPLGAIPNYLVMVSLVRELGRLRE